MEGKYGKERLAMGIPKIIHYCWFGKKSIPDKEQSCVATWKTYFPEYEFKFWYDENFDYGACLFARQAYENKKYAFVSDYARAKVLYEYGGLYLDTDVKVLKSFTDLMERSTGIAGFERKAFIGTAVLACQPNDPCIQELLSYYETHSFLQADGSFDNIANVSIFTDILKTHGLTLGGGCQTVKNFQIYSREWFYPKKMGEDSFRVTEETAAIHMCSNSWLTERERRRGNNKIWIEVIRPILRACRTVGIHVIGKERIRRLEIRLRNKIK